MRAMVVPVVLLGLVTGVTTDEPSEREMSGAFAAALADGVRSALDFLAETGGAEAVERVRQAGTDRFEIHSLRKFDCRHDRPGRAHVCAFSVEIGVVTGTLRRTLTGRFYRGPRGFVFRNEV
ncbi:MAG TPA: hypothetical protein VHA77_06080 [Xanthobacteraceae bacterium]|jgi:hypothetical protein|nr:hypothetical protein [Xanthobacteraceae bacterium]